MQYKRSSNRAALDHDVFTLIAHAEQKASTELEI